MSTPQRPLMRPQAGRYRSFAGGLYSVFGTAVDDTDGVERVVFRPAGTSSTTYISLPLETWCRTIVVDGKTAPRFVKVASPGEVEHAGEDWPS